MNLVAVPNDFRTPHFKSPPRVSRGGLFAVRPKLKTVETGNSKAEPGNPDSAFRPCCFGFPRSACG